MADRDPDSTPGSFWKTLKTDFRDSDLKGAFRRDWDESIAYFLTDRQKAKLNRSNRFWQICLISWWFLKALIGKLSPMRRLLFLAALVLLLGGQQSSETGPKMIGGIILVYLLLQELREKSFARDELSEGRAVQRALMPQETPRIEHFDVWLYTSPANDVGGDLVDHIQLADGVHDDLSLIVLRQVS